MPKQQPWMISYEYEAAFARGDDGGSRVQPARSTVLIINVPPWKFAAEHALENAADYRPPYKKDGVRLSDRILAIHWAVQIPMGGLTEEEMDALS